MGRYIGIFICILMYLGCEEITESAGELNATAHHLQTQDLTKELTADYQEANPTGDSVNLPASPVRIVLKEMKNKKAASASILTIEVTNTCEEDLEVETRLSVHGLLAFNRDLALSKKNIKVGETQTWTVPVSRLPIESDAIISQLDATAIYRTGNADDDEGAMSTKMYYYLNNTNLQTAEIFTEEIFNQKYRSRFRQKELDMKSNTALGKLKKSDGTEEIITDQSEGLDIIYNGKVVGKVLNAYESDDALEGDDRVEVMQ